MIGSDLEGAGLESRAASWAAIAISDDTAAVRAVIEAHGHRDAAFETCAWTHVPIRRHLRQRQHQPMSEQPGGDCSGI